MSRPQRYFTGSLLVAALLLCAGIGQAQPSGSPAKDSPPAYEHPKIRNLTVRDAVPDGDQFAPIDIDRGPAAPAATPARDDAASRGDEVKRPVVPLWQRLAALSAADRLNAQLALELPPRTPASARAEALAIDELWNAGAFATAVERLRRLEESGQAPGLAAAVSWRTPRDVAAAVWATDRPVSPQTQVKALALDHDAGTANLFVALAYDDPDPGTQWSVNLSTDNGLSWSETFSWFGEEVPEVHGRVVAGYFWVAYTATGTVAQSEARVRRFNVADGLQDNGYFWTTAFDMGVAIEDLSVETNADAYNNRVYVVGLLADDTLEFRWATQAGTTWNGISLGVTDAESALDAHWNTPVSGEHFLFLSYRSTLDELHVVKVDDGDVVNLNLGINLNGSTAIAAYKGRIMVACENTGTASADQIMYQVSYDGGNAWAYGTIVGASEGRNVSRLDLAARNGGGFACTYGEEIGEPDKVWYTRREYGTGPATAAWVPHQQLNEEDLFTGRSLALDYIPPTGSNAWAHGAVWIGGAGWEAYFDRDDGRRLGTPSIATGSAVSVYTVPDRGGDPLSNCYLYGGARANAVISVRVTDELGNVLSGVPAENLALRTTLGGLLTCVDGAIADGPTNGSGITTFTLPVAGGNHSRPSAGERTRVYVDGVAMSPSFNVGFNSPDANGDLQVSLADIPPFATAYFGAYDYAFDFRWDGDVNLSDVALLAGAVGATCPAGAAAAADDLALGTLGIYFDEAGSKRSLDVAPGEVFEAHLLVTGAAAAQDVRGWQCELSLSDNLLVREYVYPVDSINLLMAPRFLVGTAAPCPAAGGGVELLTLRLQVLDDRPAHIHLNRDAEESLAVPLPLVALGAESRLAALERPEGGAPGVAVARINDPSDGRGANVAGANRLELSCAPNPFNPVTEITCRLPSAGPVVLGVYDTAGRRLALLASGHHEAGEHTFRWTGRDESGREVGSGVYFSRLETAAGTLIDKMVLLR